VTLEQAFAGLLRYLDLRPDGGNRAELIAAAIAQGFEEPLLNDWLDVFLEGCVATSCMGMPAPDYDRELAPRVQQFGLVVAKRALQSAFEHLRGNNHELDTVSKVNERDRLLERRQLLVQQLAVLDQGIDLALGLISGPPRFALLLAADVGRKRHMGLIATVTRRIQQLNAEFAGTA